MSDTENTSDNEHIDDSMTKIRQYVEQIAHDAKQLYGKAVRLDQLIQTPDMDVWMEPFKIHERARPWAKKYMVASKCSLWEVNKALLEAAKAENRVGADKKVRLTKMEAGILDLSETEPVAIWAVLGKLPRFFL